MKKSKIIHIVLILAWLLQLAAEAVTLTGIWRLKMVPDGYFALLTAAFLLLSALTGLLLFFKQNNPVRRGIACALIVLILAGCGAGLFVVSKLYDTLHSITNQEPEGIAVAVYVRKDDPAQSLENAGDYTFASVQNYEQSRTQLVVDEIEAALGKSVSVTQYDSVFTMVDALYAGDVDAIILNPAYVDILEENEGYTDYSEKTRILHVVQTPEKLMPSQPEPTETKGPGETTEPVVPLEITERPFVVYLSGADNRYKISATSRSDVNILVVVNPNTHQILLLNTPRDYYVPNPAANGALDKLTHCGLYGIENSAQTLSALYGIEIDHYARINFSGFETLIDAVGGITVYSDATFKAQNMIVKKGANTFNGEQALHFARERYHVSGGDNGRGKNQMKVITAVIQKLTASTALVTNYAGIMDSLKGMFVTDLDVGDIGKLVKMQLEDMPQWEIFSFAVTGVNGREITYSMPGSRLSVMYVGQEYVDHASSLVKRMLAGDALADPDMKLPDPAS